MQQVADNVVLPERAARELSRTKTGKKRRRPKLAPRYLASSSGGDTLIRLRDTAAVDTEDECVTLLRDVFTTSTCRCFILKSFSEANLHKSLKYGIWSSTYAHNMALDQVFRSELSSVRPVLFFFRHVRSFIRDSSALRVLVCDTRHFSGIARMTSGVRTNARFELWEKRKYDGFFRIEWLLVKDVPNHALTGIKMSNTPSKKSITSCRDGEEVLFDEASEFITIFSSFPARTSAWDDFAHFDARQVELEVKRGLPLPPSSRAESIADEDEGEGELAAYLAPAEAT